MRRYRAPLILAVPMALAAVSPSRASVVTAASSGSSFTVFTFLYTAPYFVSSPSDSGDPTVAGTLSGAIAAANATNGTEIILQTTAISLSGTLPALAGNATLLLGTTSLTGTLSPTGLDVQSGTLTVGSDSLDTGSFTGSSGTASAGPAVTLGDGASLQVGTGSQAIGGSTTAANSTGGAAVVSNALTSSATILNQGTIIGGAGGLGGSYANGGDGIDATGNLVLNNSGTIAGGHGGGIAGSGGVGGIGINAGAGAGTMTLTNLSGGVIEGGLGGVAGSGDINGSGIVTTGSVHIINQSGASILGDGTGLSGVNYSGGIAIRAGAGASITNAGTIAGSGGQVEGYGIYAARSTIANQSGGLIEGGNGTEGGPGGLGIFGYDLAITNAGTIQGGRALSGTGTQADAILLTGGTNTLTLQAGSAIIGTVAVSGTSTLALGGSGTATFDMSSIGAAAQYQGFTAFEVTGTGWTLTGASGANLPVTIDGGSATVASDGALGTGSLSILNGGSLLLDANAGSAGSTASVQNGTLEVGDASHPGATLSGGVDVLSGGTLMGHGTIGGDVSNGGTVRPGGSIGVLHIGGNYTQSGAGTLSIEITPNAAAGPGIGYDQLAVTGTASLAGTLAVLDDAGSYSVGSRYTVLTAAGGRSGTFATVSYNPAFAAYITPDVSYDANNVYLSLDPTPGIGGGPPALINSGQEIPDMLSAMSATAAAVGDAVLGDVCGAAAQRGTMPGSSCETRQYGADRFELWLSGMGGFGAMTGSASQASFHDSHAGALLGAGMGQGGLTLGLGVGYAATMLNFSDTSTADQNAAFGFAYARYQTGRLHLGAMGAYGGGTIDGTRALPGTGLAATGNRSGAFAVLQTEAAYDLPLGAYTLQPRAVLAYLHAHQDGFGESGGSLLDLTYAATATDTVQTRLSARLMRRYALGSWSVLPWAEAGASALLSGLDRTVTVTDGAYGSSISGVSPAPIAGLVALGVEAEAPHGVDLYLRYQGLFSANTASTAFTAGLGVPF